MMELIIVIISLVGLNEMVCVVARLLVLVFMSMVSLVEGGVWHWFFIDKIGGSIVVLTL